MLGHCFDGHELDDRHTVVVGDVTLTSRRISHSVPTFGVRAEHGGPVLAYLGDSGPCDSLNELARDAELFVCESGATRKRPARMPTTGHRRALVGSPLSRAPIEWCSPSSRGAVIR
jgi:ribonuclease BN (tRNA processing enzyme)